MQGYLTTTTRNKNSNLDKQKHLTKQFVKKLSTDQNQKNYLNYLEKITNPNSNSKVFLKKNPLSVIPNSTKASTKKSLQQINIQKSIPIKPLSTVTSSIKLPPHKEKSVKNLKLTSSIDYPKIMVKSISQTTVNKKIDDRKFKILQKLGFGTSNNTKKNSQKQFFFLGNKNNTNSKDLFVPETPKTQLVKRNKISISQFSLGKKLGTGRFGNVYLAEDKYSKMLFAIKILSKSKIKQSEMEDQIISQIKIQMYMNHPNLLKIFGFFDDYKNIYLILQYCTQCLFKQLRQKGHFSQQETAYYCKQVISGLKYMHNQSIIHRDIKPQNILLQHDVIKLSDFGWSIYSPLQQTFCGTVDYVPPEIVEGELYDERVDIWALGVLLYELGSGNAPFETKDENITYQKILKSDYKFPTHFSQSFRDLIFSILDKKPGNRPNLDQIEGHQWLQLYRTIGRYISKQVWNAWNDLL